MRREDQLKKGLKSMTKKGFIYGVKKHWNFGNFSFSFKDITSTEYRSVLDVYTI